MSDALIVIDVQNDFCPGGALAVSDGDQIITGINQLMADAGTVVLTQDWHPAGHASFASSHAGKSPYDLVEMPYGPQVLWPDHCVQGSKGAQFHPNLKTDPAALILRKGMTPRNRQLLGIFFENDHQTPDRASRLAQNPWYHPSHTRRSRHRFLRAIFGPRRPKTGL